MAGNAEEFVIRLQQQVSGPASAAESALMKLEAQIRREMTALGGLEGKLAAAKVKLAGLQEGTGGKASIDAVQKQQAAIKGIEAAIAAAKGGIDKLGASRSQFQGILDPEKLIGKKGAIKEVLGGELGNLASAASAAGGPLGGLSDKIQGIASVAGKGGAAGVILALAAAVYALAKAIVSTAIDIARFVVTTADAARSARLLNEAAAGSARGGAELSAVIEDIAGKIPLAKDRIAEMGRQLEVAHLSGRRMQNALEAMGITASAVGDSAAARLGQIAEQAQKIRRFMVGRYDLEGTGLAFDDLAAQVAESAKTTVAQARAMLQRGQLSVDQGLEAMAAAVQKKFGGTVAAQMMALDVQMKKLHENVAAIFGGLNLEPVLRGLKLITDLFAQNTVTGRTLKAMVTALFDPLIKNASVVFPAIRAFLQGVIIGVLLLEIAVLKIKKVFVDAFGGSKSSIDWVKVALYAGIGLVGALTAAFVVLTLAVVAFGIAMVTLLLPITAGIFGIIGLVILLVVAFKKAASAIGELDLSGAAHNIVNSFVNGIKSKIGDVVSAMMGLGGAAASALKSALGIASPSKVALEAAHNVTSTFAGGVEDGAGDTQAAFRGMVDPGAVGGRQASGQGAMIYLKIDYSGDTPERRKSFLEELVETLDAHVGGARVVMGST